MKVVLVVKNNLLLIFGNYMKTIYKIGLKLLLTPDSTIFCECYMQCRRLFYASYLFCNAMPEKYLHAKISFSLVTIV